MSQINRAYDAKMTAKQAQVAATPDMRRQRDILLKILAPQSGETILEVGCGNGDLANALKSAVDPSGTITAIDPSTAMIESALAKIPNIDFQEAPATSLPCEDGSQDAVIAAQVYCFVSKLEISMQQAWRVLKSGGRLVVLDTDWDSLNWTTGSPESFALAHNILVSHYAHADIPIRLPTLLAQQGWINVEQSRVVLEDNEGAAESYAFAMNDYIETALANVSQYSKQQLNDWQSARTELIENNAFNFRMERVIISATKP